MHARIAATVLGLLAYLPVAGALQPCGPWQWVNPLPQGNDLFGVAHGPGRFVAVGALGTILTSPDGASWTCSDPATARRLHAVIWDGTRYLAVGDAGTVLLSTDSATWTAVGPVGEDDLLAVTVGGGQYIAVGAKGRIVTSPDGLSWTRQNSGTVLPLLGVTWTGDKYLAVSEGSGVCGAPLLGSVVLSSPDGMAWTAVLLPEASALRAVASNGSRSVVVGSFPVQAPFSGCLYNALVATSTDGVSWSVQEFGDVGPFLDVIWSGTEFVAVGGNSATSPDGIEWKRTGHSIATSTVALGVTVSPTTFVAVGEFGLIATSPDAGQWTTVRSDVAPFAELQNVVRSRDRWVMVAPSAYNSPPGEVVLASMDGRSWQRSTSDWFGSCSSFGPVASNGVEFIAPCGPGKVLASPDGLTWSRRSDNKYLPLEGLAWTGSEYLGFTYDHDSQTGSIYSSPDGAAWSLEFVGNNVFSDAASDASVTVATGGTLFFKPNGGSWASVASPGSSFRSVVWGGGIFVATGSAGTVARSTDGLQWTSVSSGVTVDLWDLAWDGSTFIAVGSAGTVIRSRDGIDWSADRPATDSPLYGVAAEPGCAIAAGSGGVILRLGCPEPRPVRRYLSRLPAAAPPGPQFLEATPR
jgi:hypothetical protein